MCYDVSSSQQILTPLTNPGPTKGWSPGKWALSTGCRVLGIDDGTGWDKGEATQLAPTAGGEKTK